MKFCLKINSPHYKPPWMRSTEDQVEKKGGINKKQPLNTLLLLQQAAAASSSRWISLLTVASIAVSTCGLCSLSLSTSPLLSTGPQAAKHILHQGLRTHLPSRQFWFNFDGQQRSILCIICRGNYFVLSQFSKYCPYAVISFGLYNFLPFLHSVI